MMYSYLALFGYLAMVGSDKKWGTGCDILADML